MIAQNQIKLLPINRGFRHHIKSICLVMGIIVLPVIIKISGYDDKINLLGRNKTENRINSTDPDI